MPGPTILDAEEDIVKACANQKGSFTLQFTPYPGEDLTGTVITCQIRKGVQPSVPLIVPTITSEILQTGVLSATFSWTQAQSAALLAPGEEPTSATDYTFEIDLAIPPDTTYASRRFIGTLRVSPGGNTVNG